MSISVLNTDAALSGKTLATLENAETITGLKTFDRDPSAPFAVTSGSAFVPNLDADKLDGLEAAAFAALADNETVTGNWIFSGSVTENGAVIASQSLTETGTISPAQIVANTDNYNPTGLSTARILRLSTDASRNLTGITFQVAGRRLLLCNIGAFDLVLVHDATSTAANRFYCPGSANLTLNPNDAVEIWYDSVNSRWRVIAF